MRRTLGAILLLPLLVGGCAVSTPRGNQAEASRGAEEVQRWGEQKVLRNLCYTAREQVATPRAENEMLLAQLASTYKDPQDSKLRNVIAVYRADPNNAQKVVEACG